MKKIILLFIASLFFATNLLKAQIDDNWVEAGNVAYNSTLKSIVFTTIDKGFAVGNGGSLMKTTNGGLTWTAYSTGYSFHFEEIFFVNESIGFLVGNKNYELNGRLLKTTDGGNTWQLVLSNDAYIQFLSVYFVNQNMGFVGAGSTIYKTTDGGATWTTNTSINSNITSFYFKNTNEGFLSAVLNGTPAGGYKTTDGGATWTEFEPNPCEKLFFVNQNVGYLLMASGTLVKKTTDGGLTWNPTTACGLGAVKKVVFKDELNGLVLGNTNGHIARTTDGGNSWTIVQNQTDFILNNISVSPDGKYFSCGQSGRIKRSSDNGSTWLQVQSGLLHHRLNQMCFLNDSTILAVGDAGLLVKSTDRGSSWTSIDAGTTQNLLSICKTPDNTFYIVGTNNTLLKSTNSGMNWTTSNTGFTSNTDKFGEVFFINNTTGFAGVDKLYKTTNSGSSWQQVLQPTFTPIYRMSNPGSDSLFVRTYGKIYRSTDAGNNWTEVANTLNQWHSGIDFINSDIGASCKNYDVIVTNDGGNTWQEKYISGSPGRISDIKMKTPTEMTAVGWDGTIVNTENGGTSWDLVSSNTNYHLYVLKYGPDGTGYILGDEGLVLRRANVQTYTLQFQITNTTGNPLPDASVTLNGVTYPAGLYVIEGLLPGVYNWSISCAGYCTQSGLTNVTEDTQEAIVMGNCYEALITVQNIYDGFVSGAEVTVEGQTQYTSGVGVVVFSVNEGANDLTIEKVGYETYDVVVTITSDSSLVIVLAADIDPPVAMPATGITHELFTANWTVPAGADSLLLFVSDDDFVTHIPGYNGKVLVGSNIVINGLDADKIYAYRLKAKNEFGLSSYSNTIECTTHPVSNKELTGLNQNLIYPNPATDRIFINAKNLIGIRKILIYNMEGKSVCEMELNGKDNELIEMDAAFLNPGPYIVQLLTKEKVIQTMLIVK